MGQVSWKNKEAKNNREAIIKSKREKLKKKYAWWVKVYAKLFNKIKVGSGKALGSKKSCWSIIERIKRGGKLTNDSFSWLKWLV